MGRVAKHPSGREPSSTFSNDSILIAARAARRERHGGFETNRLAMPEVMRPIFDEINGKYGTDIEPIFK